MFLTFIPSNGPICLSKCVCCVLFPARFVPMPSLQCAPFSPGVRAEASRYLYRPNSWGPPSQSSEGMRGSGDGERNYHGNFRLNQALEMSLCSIFFLSSSPSFVSLPWVSTEWPAQVSRTALTPFESHLPFSPSFISPSTLFSQFFPFFFSESHFLPRFQLKSWLFWTEHERVIFFFFFPSNCASTHFVLLLGRTKPTCCCKTELFVLLLFSSAPRLLRCLSYCEPSTL